MTKVKFLLVIIISLVCTQLLMPLFTDKFFTLIAPFMAGIVAGGYVATTGKVGTRAGGFFAWFLSIGGGGLIGVLLGLYLL